MISRDGASTGTPFVVTLGLILWKVLEVEDAERSNELVLSFGLNKLYTLSKKDY